MSDHDNLRGPARVRWHCESCSLFYEEMFDIFDEMIHKRTMIHAAEYASNHFLRFNHRWCKLAIYHPLDMLKREQLIDLGDIESTRRAMEDEMLR